MKVETILVTGAAGFIGFFLCRRLLAEGKKVVGVDNLNDYYDPALKKARLAQLNDHPAFTFQKLDIADRPGVSGVFAAYSFDVVVNLAAQAGVRYSLENPNAYVDANLVGFANILEGCRHSEIAHLVFASSSSVYGANRKLPFSVHDNVDHPVSLYAATKKANELLAHSYSHLYGLPATGLRFFTVYGPWGRPDMAYFLFTKAILAGQPIKIFNHGKMSRDFTYIDDIIEGVFRVMHKRPEATPPAGDAAPNPATSNCPYRIYNIGNNQPEDLLHFIDILEQLLDRQAIREYLPMQDGDVPATWADIDELANDVGFKPATTLADGLQRFVLWYKDYYLAR